MLEHVNGYINRVKGNVLHDHHDNDHREEDRYLTNWDMIILGTHRSPLSRLTAEGVMISEGLREQEATWGQGGTVKILNSKNDFNQAGVVQRTHLRLSKCLNNNQ